MSIPLDGLTIVHTRTPASMLGVAELAASITERGQLHPVVVNTRREVILGGGIRRLAAARLLGLPTLNAVIVRHRKAAVDELARQRADTSGPRPARMSIRDTVTAYAHIDSIGVSRSAEPIGWYFRSDAARAFGVGLNTLGQYQALIGDADSLDLPDNVRQLAVAAIMDADDMILHRRRGFATIYTRWHGDRRRLVAGTGVVLPEVAPPPSDQHRQRAADEPPPIVSESEQRRLLRTVPPVLLGMAEGISRIRAIAPGIALADADDARAAIVRIRYLLGIVERACTNHDGSRA